MYNCNQQLNELSQMKLYPSLPCQSHETNMAVTGVTGFVAYASRDKFLE